MATQPSNPTQSIQMEDLDRMFENEIEGIQNSRNLPGARGLKQFSLRMNDICKTEKKSELTNVIDVQRNSTFNFTESYFRELFENLQECIKEKTITHWSERQDAQESGIMLDYDFNIDSSEVPKLTDKFYKRTTAALAKIFYDDFVWDENKITTLHIFFTIKTITKVSSDGKGYRYGFHILIPGIKTSRDYKKWFIQNKIKNNLIIAKELKEIGLVGDPKNAIDLNSAHVPVFLFGSCKRDSIPYALGSVYTADMDEYTSVEKISKEVIDEYNLVEEMSILMTGKYVDKKVRQLKAPVEKITNDTSGHEDGLPTESDLSILTLQDIDSRLICQLLEILPPEYYTDYGLWMHVIFALASKTDKYYPIARHFSQKNPRKWKEKNALRLEELWNNAMIANEKEEHKVTISSIHYWAKKANPEAYYEILNKSHHNMLRKTVFIHDGVLEHYMVSKIIYQMIGTKYCTDKLQNGKYIWFEFVAPGDTMLPGEVWKWRNEDSCPDSIHIYISEKFTEVTTKLLLDLEKQQRETTNEDRAKALNVIIRTFKMSCKKLYNDTFKNCIIRQAQTLFRRRGFIESLDTQPQLFGVANGIVRLGEQCSLINYFHEYPVSQFTKVMYKPLDPHNPTKWQRIALNAIADIIVEPDARDWILYHACQGLSSDEKESAMLLWEGGGQNGKTTFLRSIAKALGPKADKFNIQLLSCEREDADKPNSAVMKFRYSNYAYCEEANPAQPLNSARTKELVNAGEISARDLNSKQETFTMHCNFVVASQYSFVITTTDHGTWRRLYHYTSKAKFRADPNPDSPFEKKEDQRFVKEYPNDPNFQSAILSILVYYFERLQKEHRGELKHVSCPTIKSETEKFRNSQDSLNKWICESIVVSPDSTEQFALSVLADKYKTWYMGNIENKFAKSISDTIKEIESSAISKYLQTGANKMLVLKGCRITRPEDELILEPNETMLSVKNDNINTNDVNFFKKDNWWLPETSQSSTSSLSAANSSFGGIGEGAAEKF